MNDLLGLERMVLFTPEVLVDLHGRLNGDLWPLHVLTLALAALLLARAWWARPADEPFAGCVMAGFWLWLGIGYFTNARAEVDWMAPYVAAAFILQGALLTWFGVVRGSLDFTAARPMPRGMGALLALFAIAGYPLLAWVFGAETAALPSVGLLPGPTVLFTLGVMLMARPSWVLIVLPLSWAIVGAALGWVLGMWADLALLISAGAVLSGRGYPSRWSPDRR